MIEVVQQTLHNEDVAKANKFTTRNQIEQKPFAGPILTHLQSQ